MVRIYNDEIDKRFRFHKMSDETKSKSEKTSDAIRCLADTIDLYCPESREKSLALTHLEECMFWANASLARNQ